MTSFLLPHETAQAGTQMMPKSSVRWDAVFAVSPSGSRLLAYVDGSKLAEFIAEKINEADLEELPARSKLTGPQKRLLISLKEEASDTNWVELLRHDRQPAKALAEKGLIETRTGEARLTSAGRQEADLLTFRIGR